MYTLTLRSHSSPEPELLCCLHVYAQGASLDCLDPYVVYAESQALGLRVWVPQRYLSVIYLLDLPVHRVRDQDLVL